MNKDFKPEVIIAIDFDGTICEVSYPKVGDERVGAKEYINKLYEEGYGIVINTCRSQRAAVLAMDFLDKRSIKYHYFNTNFPHLIELYGNDCRKISADVYIDDKCLFEIPTWEEKYKIIKTKFPTAKRGHLTKLHK